MNIKLFNAATTQIRGKALESLALIDLLLNDPTMVPEHSNLVDEIVTHSRKLAEYEGALLTLQQYFAPRAPAPQPHEETKTGEPKEPATEVASIDEAKSPKKLVKSSGIPPDELLKRSPTMRKAMSAQRRRRKKEKE